MPEIRPFRALRYVAESVGDLSVVVAPPYDVIGPEEQRRLLDRHPKNVVRLDLPTAEPREEPEERYRRAARTLAAWRSDGTFHKDPRSAVYVYEQVYRVPGSDVERTQRGFFGRVRLEPFGPSSGIRPHERTLEAPREDRYRLLRATGVNTSPVVMLHEDQSGRTAAALAAVSTFRPAIDVRDDDGVRHRLWVVEVDGEHGPAAATLLEAAASGPLTIADGHHRYETALRYRDERRMARSCEEDPAFDYVLTLLLETTTEPLTVLPTHRVVRELDTSHRFREELGRMFDVRPAGRAALEREFGSALATGGRGRFGLWTRDGGSILETRPEAIELLASGVGAEVRKLDAWLLGAMLERIGGLDAAAVAAGDRIWYTKAVTEALAAVDEGADRATAAFLLEPTPVAAIAAVAGSGEVMPQKSTYFYPKALTGLVINPHEW